MSLIPLALRTTKMNTPNYRIDSSGFLPGSRSWPFKKEVRLHEQLQRTAVLIPSWEPDEHLVELVRSLIAFPFRAIIVVNDGSGNQYDEIFARVSSMPSVIVLRHSKNQGQGCAVRTAMRHALDSLAELGGVVTSDADGQHAVEDIVRVALETTSSGKPVLGVRTFTADVPLRSRFGNVLTQYVFTALSGMAVADTQSGLRGIPVRLLPAMLTTRGDRFEFAVSVLAELGRQGALPRQIPIQTIYIDQNRSSHFRPVRDSVRIYLFLLRLYAAELIPICADFVAFALAFLAIHRVGPPMLIGRICAFGAALPFTFFTSVRRAKTAAVAVKQIAMLAGTGLVSWGAVTILTGWQWNAIVAKVAVETAILILVAILKPALRSKADTSGN